MYLQSLKFFLEQLKLIVFVNVLLFDISVHDPIMANLPQALDLGFDVIDVLLEL